MLKEGVGWRTLISKIRGYTFEMSPETFERLVSRSSHGLIKSIACVDDKMLVNGVEVKNIDDVIYSTKHGLECLAGLTTQLKGPV